MMDGWTDGGIVVADVTCTKEDKFDLGGQEIHGFHNVLEEAMSSIKHCFDRRLKHIDLYLKCDG